MNCITTEHRENSFQSYLLTLRRQTKEKRWRGNDCERHYNIVVVGEG
jgi:hypothetical protein